MKKCKNCQKEIDPKAKKCPFCQSDLRNWFARHPILTVLLVLFVLGIFGSASGGNKGTKTPTTTSSSVTNTQENVKETVEKKQEQTQIFKIGDTVKMSDYESVVNNVKRYPSYGYGTPKAGNEYVMVNITLRNIGSKEVSYNPYDFKIQDSNGNQTTETYALLEDSFNSGSLALNGIVTGTIPFETPKGDQKLKLIYQPNVWLDNQRINIELVE